MTTTKGGKAMAAGFFTLALFAHLGVLSDGKMGVSKARAERVKAALTAQAAAEEAWA